MRGETIMSITMEMEYELNRAWVYDDEDDDPIGETNFVVPAGWFVNTFNKLNNENKFICKYEDFEDFIDSYEPETDGELIYQKAIEDGVLKEDIGVVYY
jgi:hypothetical protein